MGKKASRVELIFHLILCVISIGALAGVYDWMTGNGNYMDDLVMSGLACNALLFLAFLLVII